MARVPSLAPHRHTLGIAASNDLRICVSYLRALLLGSEAARVRVVRASCHLFHGSRRIVCRRGRASMEMVPLAVPALRVLISGDLALVAAKALRLLWTATRETKVSHDNGVLVRHLFG